MNIIKNAQETTAPLKARYIAVGTLVFFFPVVAMLIPHGPTAIFALLILAGLAAVFQKNTPLSLVEKTVLTGFLFIFISAALSLLNTDDIANSVSKLERYLFFVYIVPVYLLLRKYNDYIVWAFVFGLVVSAVLIGLVAFFQVEIGDQLRARGIRHHIMFGSFATIVSILLLLAAAILSKRGWHYALWSVPFILGAYAAIESGSRNALLALPITATALLFLVREQVKVKGWIAVAALVVMTVGGTVLFTDGIVSGFEKGISEVRSYVRGDTETPTSLGLRLNMWRNSLEILKKHPVIGAGIGDYQSEMEQLIESGFSYSAHKDLYLHEAHSSYFHSLAVSGSLGFLSFVSGVIVIPLWAFWLALRKAKTNHDPLEKFAALGGISTIIAFAVFGLGTAWQEKNTFLAIYLVFTSVLLAHAYRPKCRGSGNGAEV